MSAVSKRVYEDWQRAQREIARLRVENARLAHECHLAYLEGLDQGRAEAEAMEAAS
jgi:hypothetical protein